MSPSQIHPELGGKFKQQFSGMFEPYPKVMQEQRPGLHSARSGEGAKPHRSGVSDMDVPTSPQPCPFL